jgi:short-subunit dehydrogenase
MKNAAEKEKSIGKREAGRERDEKSGTPAAECSRGLAAGTGPGEGGAASEHPGLAVVTGATSGIGAAFAEALAGRGHDLLLTGRREEKLNGVAERLRRERGVRVETVLAELTDPEEIRRLAERLASLPLEILVNNAGFGARALLVEGDPEEQERMVRIHILCPLRLTRAVLPGMIRRGRGAVINVSSEAAFLPVPRNGVYSGAKAFLRAFSESIRLELTGTGVRIQALCPGLTRTDFHSRVGMERPSSVGRWSVGWLTPEQVVTASLRDLDRDRTLCIPGLGSRLRTLLPALLPQGLYYALLHRFFRASYNLKPPNGSDARKS